jgi:hypothetical protein
MPSFTVEEVEQIKDMPDAKYGPAKVLRLTLKNEDRRPEWFTKAATPEPEPGSTIEGDIEPSDFGPKWKPAGSRQGGGGGQYQRPRSPAEELRIVRQHAHEMACRVQDTLGRVLSEQEFQGLINWFVADTYRKDKGQVTIWPMTSDVPIDMSGTPFE